MFGSTVAAPIDADSCAEFACTPRVWMLMWLSLTSLTVPAEHVPLWYVSNSTATLLGIGSYPIWHPPAPIEFTALFWITNANPSAPPVTCAEIRNVNVVLNPAPTACCVVYHAAPTRLVFPEVNLRRLFVTPAFVTSVRPVELGKFGYETLATATPAS